MKQTERTAQGAYCFLAMAKKTQASTTCSIHRSGGRRKRADLYHSHTAAGHRKNVARMETTPLNRKMDSTAG